MTTPPYPLHPQPLKKSWLDLNPRWKIPLGCLTLLLLIGGFSAGLMTIIITSFHRSDVYQQSMDRASQDPQVRALIGEPIKAGWLVSGQLSISGSTGSANLSIPISGPRGKGVIRAVAHKSGIWKFESLQVVVDGQPAPIDLLSVQPPPGRDF